MWLCRGGGAGRPCSPLSLGPPLTSDLGGSLSAPFCRSRGSCSPVPTAASPRSGRERAEGLMRSPQCERVVWPQHTGGCQPDCGCPATIRVLTASSLSSHRKTWFPMTRTCTNARRTNTTPISAVMEKATAVSTGPSPAPPRPQPGLGTEGEGKASLGS